MTPLENVTMAQIKDAAIVLLALAGVVVLIGNLWKTIKTWRQPHEDLIEWRRDVDEKLRTDNDRLKSIEQGNKVLTKGMLALISHEINGNSDDKLRASQAEIQDYLIER